MTDWLKWLVGLAALIVLGWLGIHTQALGQGSATRAQERIEARVADRLALIGANWARATIDGQTVRLSGAAPDAATRDRVAAALLEAEWSGGLVMGGVTRVFTDAVTVGVPRTGPYAWSAELDESRLLLSGLTPDAATASTLVERARIVFNGREVINRMTIDPTAPDAAWTTAATSALDALGHLAVGRAEITDRAVAVSGRARNAANVASAERTLAGLSAPYAVRFDIEAPPEAPAAPPGDPLPTALSTEPPASTPAPAPATEAPAPTPTPAPAVPGETLFERVARVLSPAEQSCQDEFDAALDGRTVQFRSASAALSEDGRLLVDELAQIARRCAGMRLTIEGHTDSTGQSADNQTLSQDRADIVRQRFIAAGVPATQLISVGYGQDRPIATNGAPEGRARNRRIEILVTP